MSLWEATRPTSLTTTFGTIVGCGNSFDVQSAAPDTTTVMSFNTNSAGTGRIVWNNWQVPATVPDSAYLFGIQIACKSMGTGYLTFEYSVNSGANWNALISSVGGTNLGATTITKSLAANVGASSMWVRCSLTNVHSRGRAQLWDVYLVGSYHQNFVAKISEAVGMTDNAGGIYGQGFTRTNADNLGVADSLNRSLTIARLPGSLQGAE